MNKFVEKHKTVRAFLHIPVGLLCGFALLSGWAQIWGVVFFISFIIYELNEDFHLKDEACWDIAGFLWGLALSVIILNALRFLF